MEQEEQPSFRRYVEDRRYYEVPARFAMHTAYMEVSNMQWWNRFSFTLLLSPTAIFNLVSNIIPGCFGFALFLFVIGPENSRHFLNQSDATLKPIATCLLASSHALVTCVFPRFDYVRFPRFG